MYGTKHVYECSIQTCGERDEVDSAVMEREKHGRGRKLWGGERSAEKKVEEGEIRQR